jgi:hypothetical protein
MSGIIVEGLTLRQGECPKESLVPSRPSLISWLKLLPLVGIAFLLSACDPDGKKKCEWVLEPEVNLRGTTDPGFIPVCARNRTTQKEDCRLQTTLEYAQKIYGRKFRYVDLRVESPGLPRTVAGIKFCDKGEG